MGVKARRTRLVLVLVLAPAAERGDDDGAPPRRLANATSRFVTVESWQADVQQCDIGPVLARRVPLKLSTSTALRSGARGLRSSWASLLTGGQVMHRDDGSESGAVFVQQRSAARLDDPPGTVGWRDDHLDALYMFALQRAVQRDVFSRHRRYAVGVEQVIVLRPALRGDAIFGQSVKLAGGAVEQGQHAVGITRHDAVLDVFQQHLEETVGLGKGGGSLGDSCFEVGVSGLTRDVHAAVQPTDQCASANEGYPTATAHR